MGWLRGDDGKEPEILHTGSLLPLSCFQLFILIDCLAENMPPHIPPPSGGSNLSICQGVSVYSRSTVGPFGIVAYPLTNATDSNQTSEAIIVYLDGWCSGRLVDKPVQVVGVNTSLTGS